MIHPRIIKIITDDMISPCCNALMKYNFPYNLYNKTPVSQIQSHIQEDEYYCSNSTCPLQFVISDTEKNNHHHFVYFNFIYSGTIALHIFVDYNTNEFDIFEISKNKTSEQISIMLKNIPKDLEFNIDYFNRKIPLWLTFS